MGGGHLAVCQLNCGESPGSGRCDWEGCWPPHLFVDLPWMVAPPWPRSAFSRELTGTAGVANTSSTRECRSWQRSDLFLAGARPRFQHRAFLVPSAHYPSNFYTSVDAMLILIASCFDFLPVSTTNPTTTNSSPSRPFLPLSARVTICNSLVPETQSNDGSPGWLSNPFAPVPATATQHHRGPSAHKPPRGGPSRPCRCLFGPYASCCVLTQRPDELLFAPSSPAWPTRAGADRRHQLSGLKYRRRAAYLGASNKCQSSPSLGLPRPPRIPNKLHFHPQIPQVPQVLGYSSSQPVSRGSLGVVESGPDRRRERPSRPVWSNRGSSWNTPHLAPRTAQIITAVL